MRALLDVNVLIALLDPDHVFHDRAHRWWAHNRAQGWASCPLTENGVVRIVSNPSYSRSEEFTPKDLILRLREFAHRSDHEFWPDDLSLCDPKVFSWEYLISSRQITDAYLLALAVARGGRLATFDRNVASESVKGATTDQLSLL